MAFREKSSSIRIESEESGNNRKKFKHQNLLSPGYLDSDLPSQVGLIRVQEENMNAISSHYINGLNNISDIYTQGDSSSRHITDTSSQSSSSSSNSAPYNYSQNIQVTYPNNISNSYHHAIFTDLDSCRNLESGTVLYDQSSQSSIGTSHSSDANENRFQKFTENDGITLNQSVRSNSNPKSSSLHDQGDIGIRQGSAVICSISPTKTSQSLSNHTQSLSDNISQQEYHSSSRCYGIGNMGQSVLTRYHDTDDMDLEISE
jgi:hypothetical protein